MKIKRKKMATRQSGPCHEVQRVTPGSSGTAPPLTGHPQKSSAKNSNAIGSSENCKSTSNNIRQQNGTLAKNCNTGNCTNNNGAHKSHQSNVSCGNNGQHPKSTDLSGLAGSKKNSADDNINNHKDDSIGEEKLERRDVGTWVRTVGGGTDAECFGPCEPGTAVNLEGIVWHETAAGILVVNVTWRGKSYVGTLLDCTKSEWAAPRFCESPNSDLDGSKTATKGRNVKRSAANSNSSSSSLNNGGSSNNNNNNRSGNESVSSRGQTKSQDVPSGSTNGDLSGVVTEKPESLKFEAILEPSSPLLFECPLDGCQKKYGQLVALKYHQNSSHRNNNNSIKEKANKSKDVATMTMPLLIESAEQAGSKGQQPSVDNIPHQDLSPNSKKQLSKAENESLENLFKVVPQIPGSSLGSVVQSPKGHKGSVQKSLVGVVTNDAAPSGEGQPSGAPGGTLTTQGSKTPPLSAMSKTPPVLQIDDRRPTSRNSNNYSDVSDPEDEAPTLERHNSPLVAPGHQGATVVAQQQATSAGPPIGQTIQGTPPEQPPIAPGNGGAGARFQGPPVPAPSSTSAIVPDLKPQNTGKSVELSMQTINNMKKTPIQSLKTLPVKPEPTNSPQMYLPIDRPPAMAPPPVFTFPYSFAGGHGPPTIIPNPGPLVYEPNPGPPLVYGGGPMFAFPIGSGASMNHQPPTLLTSPSQASYFAVPVPPPHPPQSTIGQSPTAGNGGGGGGVLNSTNQHKIHELSSADSMLRPQTVGSAPSPGGGRRSADDKKSSSSSSSSDSNVIVHQKGRLDDQSSRSPPVQRHHHLHHHTHSYPLLAGPNPYTAMLASQQAAAASVVGAFPPFARKQ